MLNKAYPIHLNQAKIQKLTPKSSKPRKARDQMSYKTCSTAGDEFSDEMADVAMVLPTSPHTAVSHLSSQPLLCFLVQRELEDD